MDEIDATSKLGVALAFALAGACASVAVAAPDPDPAPPDAQLSPAAHNDREAAVAERLQLSLKRGRVRWIVAAAEEFLAIERTAIQAPANGGVIINVPVGTIVDSLPLYRALARSAAAAGWTVLSIQPPLPTAGADSAQIEARAIARLDAAIGVLASQDIENVVIVGDADGAAIAVRFIAAQASPAISGFVGVGAWDASVDALDIPVLGVTGTRDTRALSRQALRMARLGPREAPVEVLRIDGAGRRFSGYEDMVAKRVRGWLERSAPGTTVMRKRAPPIEQTP